MRLKRKLESLFPQTERPSPLPPAFVDPERRRSKSIGGMSLRRGDPNLINNAPTPRGSRRYWDVRPANYEWIPGWCAGKEAFIVGGDGSLFGFNFELLRDRENTVVIAVNNSIKELPFADAMVFLDPATKKTCGYDDLRKEKFRVVCSTNGHLDAGGNVTVLQATTRLTDHPRDGIFSTITSAHMGMTLALWGGASKIRLIGVGCNQFTVDRLEDYRQYVKDNPWYPAPDMEALEKRFKTHKRLQHYYAMDRRETRSQDGGAYFHMAKSFGIYREHSSKIVVHNFMSRIGSLAQSSIKEVTP